MARGCSPFGAVAGPARPQISGNTLREPPWKAIHADDRGVVQRARNAAEAGLRRASAAGAPVSREIVGLFDRTVAIAEELAQARAFVATNTPEAVGRMKADLEVRAIEAGLLQKKAMDEERKALDAKAARIDAIRGEVNVMIATLQAGAATLEGIEARLSRSDAAGLAADLSRQQEEAKRALDAWSRTADEMKKLR
jgi:hypothetical protein